MDTIDEIISKEAYDQVDRMGKDLLNLKEIILDVVKASKENEVGFKGAKDYATMIQYLNEFNKVQERTIALNKQAQDVVERKRQADEAAATQQEKFAKKNLTQIDFEIAKQKEASASANQQIQSRMKQEAAAQKQREDFAKRNLNAYDFEIAKQEEASKAFSQALQQQIRERAQAEQEMQAQSAKSNLGTNISDLKVQIDANNQLAASYRAAAQEKSLAATQSVQASGEALSGIELEQQAEKLLQKAVQLDIENKQLLQNANREVASGVKNLIAAETLLTNEKNNLNKAIQQEIVSIEKGNNAYEELKVEYADAANRAKMLGAELFQLKASGTATTEQIQTSAAAYRDAQKGALLLSNGLKEIEMSVGQSQRNVGNYNGLLAQTNMVLRELPNFAISAQTGILSLSNNLPYFADELKRVAGEIDNVTGKKKGWAGALKELSGAVFSWQTLLLVVIGVLIKYNKEIGGFISEMFGAKKSIDETTESMDALKQAFESQEFAKVTADIIQLTEQIKLAKEGVIDKDKVLHQYNETIGKTIGQVKNWNDIENKLVQDTPAYLQMMALKAAAAVELEKASKKIAEAEETKQTKDLGTGETILALRNNMSTLGKLSLMFQNVNGVPTNPKTLLEWTDALNQGVKDKADGLQKEADTYTKVYQSLLDQAADIAKKNKFNLFPELDYKEKKPKTKTSDTLNSEIKNYEEYNKALADLEKQRELTQQAADQKVFDDESQSLQDRLKAYQDFVNSKGSILFIDHNVEVNDLMAKLQKIESIEQIDAKKRTKQQQSLLLQKDAINAQLLTAQEKYELQVQELQDDSAKKEASIRKSDIEKQIKIINDGYQAIKDASDGELAIRLANLEKEKELGEMTQKEYYRKRQQIQSEESKKLFDNEYKFLKDYFDKIINDPTISDDVKKFVLKLYGDFEKAKPSPKKQENPIMTILGWHKNTVEESLAEIGQQIKTLYDSLWDLVDKQRDAYYQKRFDQLDEEKNKIEQNAQAEKDAIESSLLSQDEKQKKEHEIDVRAQAQETALDNKKKALQKQQAQAEKRDAIFKAGLEAGVAIVRAFAENKFPLSLIIAGLVAANTAVQIAAIRAQPVPEYFRGTENHIGGLAKIGERGRELVELPSGYMFLSPDKETIADLPKGTKVKTHGETETMLSKIREGSRQLYETLVNHAASDTKITPDFGNWNRIFLQQGIRQTEQLKAMENVVQNNMDAVMITSEIKSLKSAILNKKETHFYWDNGELKKSYKIGNTTIKYVNGMKGEG